MKYLNVLSQMGFLVVWVGTRLLELGIYYNNNRIIPMIARYCIDHYCVLLMDKNDIKSNSEINNFKSYIKYWTIKLFFAKWKVGDKFK